ncbi:MAG: TetR/AcrR family transcriptional regulator [Nitrospirota bacterium]
MRHSKPIERAARPSGHERQASIIAAAAALFAANGFKGTTTREIARTAGISEALLFKHFPTKRALYAAILAEKAPLSQLLAAVEAAARKRNDHRVFTLIASHRIRRASDPTLLRLLLFSALEGHDLSDMFFRNQHRVFYDYLAGYIAKRVEDGAFQRVDPLLAARAFMGMVAHHRLLHEIFRVREHRTPEDSVAAYVSLFLDGIRARPRHLKLVGRKARHALS